ncbi:hypothetical protein SRIMM317S_03972 [Streptomyces rimosus subsp. rimosus]
MSRTMSGPTGVEPLAPSPTATMMLLTPSVDEDRDALMRTPPGPSSTVHTGGSARVGTAVMTNWPRPSAHTSTPMERASDASVPSIASHILALPGGARHRGVAGGAAVHGGRGHRLRQQRLDQIQGAGVGRLGARGQELVVGHHLFAAVALRREAAVGPLRVLRVEAEQALRDQFL